MTGQESPQGSPIGEDDLQRYIDRRLAGERLRMVESYLASHPEIRERLEADRQIRDSIRLRLDEKLEEPIPSRLRIASIQASRRTARAKIAPMAAAAVVIFALGALAGWTGNAFHGGTFSAEHSPVPSTAVIAQDAASAYRTYVVEVVHPVEVDAAHEAHLVQWLSKRLKKSLVVPNLSQFGYRLMGGRLLPAGSDAAAQLMYDDPAGKRLTVYVQASEGSETAFRFQQAGDAATFAWIDRGFGFAVTGAENRDRLLPIAEAVYRSFSAAEASPTNSAG